MFLFFFFLNESRFFSNLAKLSLCLEENLNPFYVCLCPRAEAVHPREPLPEFSKLMRNMLLSKHIREHIVERQLKDLRAALVLVTCCQTPPADTGP